MINADINQAGQVLEKQIDRSMSSASIVLKEVWRMLAPTSVLEVGYTDTHWQSAAQALGALNLAGVWDPALGVECEGSEFFTSIQCAIESEDWRTGLDAEKRFDLVISLKVAASLSAERAPFFIEALCDGADLVLFSGIIPELLNADAMNSQSPCDWSAIFHQHDFVCFDFLRPALWDNPDVEWQYLQNALLFARRGSGVFNTLAEFGLPVEKPMTLVHPKVHAQAIHHAERQMHELKRIAFENPFGRDNHIRTLEDKVEKLRSSQELMNAAYKELSESYDTVVTSWSWKFTAPFRALNAWLGRDATTD